MLRMLSEWYQRYFSDEEAIVLLLLLTLFFGVILLFGEVLAPVFTALVIAYLLMGLVQWFTRKGTPDLVAVWIVFVIFLGIVATILFVFLPFLCDGQQLYHSVSRSFSVSLSFLFVL